MQTNLNHSLTIKEFQEHLENTQQLLSETQSLNERERNELQLRIDTLQKEIVETLQEARGEVGVWDSIRRLFGSKNTVKHKITNALNATSHLVEQLNELNQRMLEAAEKYEEMRVSVKFLCRNFQSLLDSNRHLECKVDSLEDKVNEQNRKMDEQSRKIDMLLKMQLKAEQERGQQNERGTEQNTTRGSSFSRLTSSFSMFR